MRRVMFSFYSSDFSKQEYEKKFKVGDYSFDKGMYMLLLFMELDAATSQNLPEEKLNQIKRKVEKQLDKAVSGFKATICQGKAFNQVKEVCERLEGDIERIKKTHSISRQLFEVILLKLTLIHDLAHENPALLPGEWPTFLSLLKTSNNTENIEDFFNFFNNNFCEHQVGKIHRRGIRIVPIYSVSASIGINTILFAMLNNYFPIGFGDLCRGSAYLTADHDYVHASQWYASSMNDPDAFKTYKSVYESLFNARAANLIDETTFKKDLFFLFFLVHEMGFSKEDLYTTSIEKLIITRTRPLSEVSESFLEECKADPTLQISMVQESIDFVVPLKKMGYDIPFNKDKPAESNSAIRMALLDLLEGFRKRHPEVKLSREQIIEPERVETTAAMGLKRN